MMREKYNRVCLNVGCGFNPKETTDEELWINIDTIDFSDIFRMEEKYQGKNIIFEQLDLDFEQEMINDHYYRSDFFEKYGRFDLVIMKDVFEHLKLPLKTMYDIWLSCKPDALVEIECPYQGSHGAWSDIGHLREVNETMLLSLTDEFYELNKELGSCFSPHKLKYPFSFSKVSVDMNGNEGRIERIKVILQIIKK